MNPPDDELRALAVDLAHQAGKILLSMTAGVERSKSSPTDLVTEADRAAEDYIFGRLREERPQDSVLAEEGSVHEGTTGIRWVIDPLDGTINYVYGLPQWCVSIGIEGEVRAGVIHDPNRMETFTDSDRLTPSRKTELPTALIATGFSYSSEMRARQAAVLAQVLPNVRDVRRFGSAALDLAWVAAGRFDGFFEDDTHHWDISGGIAVIEGAGGAVRTHGALTIAAGTPDLLDRLESLVLAAM
jgi:myo-inositol-1(or 4)-monophosphatase